MKKSKDQSFKGAHVVRKEKNRIPLEKRKKKKQLNRGRENK